MVSPRTKLRIGSRVAIRGRIDRFTEKDGRPQITVAFRNAPMPITLDAMWANRDNLKVSDEVRLEATLERINHGHEAKWDTASLKVDGFAYRVTLPINDIDKA